MDLTKLLKALYIERGRLDQAIASLEELQRVADERLPVGRERRGRKFMGPAERREVSARMKEFWKRRRQRRD